MAALKEVPSGCEQVPMLAWSQQPMSFALDADPSFHGGDGQASAVSLPPVLDDPQSSVHVLKTGLTATC